MDQPIKIQIIIGSTRQNRFSEKPAQWIFAELQKNQEVQAELVDLRDFPLPFYDEPLSPSRLKGNYSNDIAKKWAEKVGQADGYIFVTPEYNHGTSAVLKNAIDYVFEAWQKKPVGFISYGSVGGARAIEQLRQTVIELQMVPIRSAIHIPGAVYMAITNKKEDDTTNPFESLETHKEGFLDQLLWWTKTLKPIRE